MLQRVQRSAPKTDSKLADIAQQRAKRKPPPPKGLEDYQKAKRAEAEKTARLRRLRLAREAEQRAKAQSP
jgi:hypothetical protein